MSLKLVLGNKTYSSWSLRPWLLLRALEIPFDEVVLPLYEPATTKALLGYSPAGKAPILIDGDVTVWDSLAIVEYVAERFPQQPVWPREPAARALARALSAEMHSGFLPLRRAMPMNLARTPKKPKLDAEVRRAVAADVKRIEQAFAESRARYGGEGPFLFGAFGAVDAMYAPVVSRLDTYEVAVSDTTQAYMDAIMALQAWRDWAAGAAAESWRIERFEVA